jgi:hypothetical protein
MRRTMKTFGLGLACMIAVGTANPAHSASIPSLSAALKNTGVDSMTEVRWRGRGRGPGIGLGTAGAVLAGAALAGGPYGYGGHPVYAYDPAYSGYHSPPNHGYSGYSGCVTDEGYGRFTSCDH